MTPTTTVTMTPPGDVDVDVDVDDAGGEVEEDLLRRLVGAEGKVRRLQAKTAKIVLLICGSTAPITTLSKQIKNLNLDLLK